MSHLVHLKSQPKPGAGPVAGVAEHALGLKIGDLAKATGKTQRALRLYEELGLLTPGTRSEGGFRIYGPEAIARVSWIGKLQELGFTLQQIHELVAASDAVDPPRAAMARVRALFTMKQAEVAAHIARLQQLQQELTSSLDFLETCVDACTEPAVQSAGTSCCGTCQQHGEQKAPDLVEGIRTPS
jgi:MerR family transcriptional regulator, copper efflux regulator